MSEILSIQGLSKRFGAIWALQSADLTVERGQVFGLLGPNGSGKTTTLGLILGVLRATSGSYSWFGEGESANLRRRIGSLLEQPNFYPWLSAYKNLQITAAIRGVDARQIDETLKKVGLEGRKKDPVSTYSLGMKQRLALGACLLGDPEVLVLDEPTNGVDAQGIAELRTLIKKQAEAGKTVILASHILDEVEKVCSHVAVMKQGQVIHCGPISEVLSQGQWLEVSASNTQRLKVALEKHPHVKKVESLGAQGFKVLYDSQLTAEVLNQYLFDQQIVLNRLVQRHQSLEQHFLELLKSEPQR